MSGLYNALFGYNPLARHLLLELGIDHHDVPRFRDCFLSADGSSVVILTRTGGGNRKEYAEQNAVMTRRAGYLRDEDDSFDTTYALFHFAVPESIKHIIPLALEKGHGVDMTKRWKQVFDILKGRATAE